MQHPNALVSPATLGSLPPSQQAAIAFLARHRGNTHDLYRFHLKTFFDWCQNEHLDPLVDVTRGHLELYVYQYFQTHKASTTNTAFTPIRGFYKFAHIDGRITSDPSAYVNLPKPEHHVKANLDPYQVKRILIVARDLSPRHWCLTQMLCVMGMRVSEACSITVEQTLNVEQGIRVINYVGKGSVVTKKAIPYQALAAVDAQVDGRTAGPLLTRLDGRPLTRSAAGGMMDTVSKHAGLGIRINPHYLRAIGASTLDNIEDMQEFLSHADLRTTQKWYDLRSKHVASQSVHLVGARLAI